MIGWKLSLLINRRRPQRGAFNELTIREARCQNACSFSPNIFASICPLRARTQPYCRSLSTAPKQALVATMSRRVREVSASASGEAAPTRSSLKTVYVEDLGMSRAINRIMTKSRAQTVHPVAELAQCVLLLACCSRTRKQPCFLFCCLDNVEREQTNPVISWTFQGIRGASAQGTCQQSLSGWQASNYRTGAIYRTTWVYHFWER
jgi:hypothetical protein